MRHYPFFSITTPCWNSEKTLERTIKSILSQKFTDYEYIIIDGGSTDNTLDIIKKYEPLFDGRMKWKSEPDKGLYDAFNKGVERSNGIYCWNVNSDDYISDNALEVIYSFIKLHNWEKLPIIAGGMNLVDEKGNIISSTKQSKKKIIDGYQNDYIGVSHPSTLVPKAVYDRIGTFDTFYKIIGDLDWFHRAYEANERFEVIDFVLSNMSNEGITYQFNYRRSLRDRLYFLKKFYNNPIMRLNKIILWTLRFYSIKYSYLKNINL